MGQYVIPLTLLSPVPLLTLPRHPVFMCWRTSRMGIFFTQNGLWAMEKCRLVPKGTHSIGNDLATAADALIKGGQSKLFTPMALWVCTKVGSRSGFVRDQKG